MSLTMTQAEDIVEKARNTFSQKTTNKIYAKSTKSEAPLPDTNLAIESASKSMDVDLEADLDRLDHLRELTKAINRNNTVLASRETKLRSWNQKTGTPYKRGWVMY
jgi:hypothetical protein